MDSVYCTWVVEVALLNSFEHCTNIMTQLRENDLCHMEVEELINDYIYDMITINADTNLILHDLLMASFDNIDFERLADIFIKKYEIERAS